MYKIHAEISWFCIANVVNNVYNLSRILFGYEIKIIRLLWRIKQVSLPNVNIYFIMCPINI